MLRRSEATLFLRATPAALGRPNNLFKTRDRQSANSPFETQGNMSMSFEKILEQAQKKMPFPITDNMYDRPGVQQYTTNPADADKMPNKGKMGAPKENGGGGQSIFREMDDMVDPTKLKKSQLPWERVYNAEEVKMSKLDAAYYYEEGPSKEALKASYQRRVAISVLVCASVFSLYLCRRVSDPIMSGQSVGNQEPTWGVPHQAPPGYEIVRLDPKTGEPIENPDRFRPPSEADLARS